MPPLDLAAKSEQELHVMLVDFHVEGGEVRGELHRGGGEGRQLLAGHNGVSLKRKVRIKGTTATPSLRDERTPTASELKSIFLACDRRARGAASLVSHAGLRLENLGDYLDGEGLRLKGLPELRIRRTGWRFKGFPP